MGKGNLCGVTCFSFFYLCQPTNFEETEMDLGGHLLLEVSNTTFCSMTPSDEFETITVRVPKALKSTVEQFLEARGTSLTALVRDALQETVAPTRRMYELPGLTKAFSDFCEEAQRFPVMVLVTNDHDGRRTFFEGRIDRNQSNESLLTLQDVRDGVWVIPKKDIVGWFLGNVPASTNKLAMNLRRLGWAAPVPYY